MKRSALLVNVARAEVAQEQALFDALQHHDIAGAVLDVWYAYPVAGVESLAPAMLPFHELANVRATPHLAGWSQALATRRYADIAQNIERLRTGKPLANALR
jgi:phosphoglycerate dehydrogenase-like enzyme